MWISPLSSQTPGRKPLSSQQKNGYHPHSHKENPLEKCLSPPPLSVFSSSPPGSFRIFSPQKHSPKISPQRPEEGSMQLAKRSAAFADSLDTCHLLIGFLIPLTWFFSSQWRGNTWPPEAAPPDQISIIKKTLRGGLHTCIILFFFLSNLHKIKIKNVIIISKSHVHTIFCVKFIFLSLKLVGLSTEIHALIILALLQKLKLMTLYFMTLSKNVIIEGIQWRL